MIYHNMTINELKQYISTIEISQLSNEALLELRHFLLEHEKKTCQQLGMKLDLKIESVNNEKKRMEMMFLYEKEAWESGMTYIAGVDEAGRGPLVGPVVAASVILDPKFDWSGINDSKKLSEKKRNYYYDAIISHAIAYGIGVATHKEIDEINILNATKLAMTRAIEAMHIVPELLLLDAVSLKNLPIKQLPIIKGDAKSASIAAASILAKVTRDRMLDALDVLHPLYGFAQHKGYGTDQHYAAIRKYGLIPEHRKSFLKNVLND